MKYLTPLLIIWALVVSRLLVAMPVRAQAAPTFIIIELQTGSATSANDEFVELYYAGTEPLDLAGWQLQYRSATGTTWNTKTNLNGKLMPRSRWLVGVQASFPAANQSFAAGLAKTGGSVRVVHTKDGVETETDRLGWGTAVEVETTASAAPADGSSLKRLVNADGYFIDSNNNSTDYVASTTPTPFGDPVYAVAGAECEAPTSNGSPGGSSPTPSPTNNSTTTTSTAKLWITELLIDPDKPGLDAVDEFIELYNPNAFAVNLRGYTLKTGLTGRDSFTFPDFTLAARQYRAFKSGDTKLGLSNTEGKAQLFLPNGTLAFATAEYSKAKPNIAWAYFNGKWAWTSTTTPGGANKEAATGSATSASTTSGSVTSFGTPTSTSATLAATNQATSRDQYQAPPTASEAQVHRAILVGVGALAVLYAGYEYRHDLGNRLAILRRYLGLGRRRRAAVEGR